MNYSSLVHFFSLQLIFLCPHVGKDKKSGEVVLFKCVPFILSLSIFLIGQQIPDGEPLLLKSPGEEVSRGLSYYENILRKNPDLPEAHFGAGHSAYSIENYKRAQQEFNTSSQSERKDLRSK